MVRHLYDIDDLKRSEESRELLARLSHRSRTYSPWLAVLQPRRARTPEAASFARDFRERVNAWPRRTSTYGPMVWVMPQFGGRDRPRAYALLFAPYPRRD